jgi:peptide chain release factor 1
MLSGYQAKEQQLLAQLAVSDLKNIDRIALHKELSAVQSVLEQLTLIDQLRREHDSLTQELATTQDSSLRSLYEDELINVTARRQEAQSALDTRLYPPDELDNRNVFIEIRAGTGGQEAALFAGDLMRMYLLYATKKGWQTSVVSESSTDLGGYREVVLQIIGKEVYRHLKRESGVHRVQRVPKTETAGRIHTSTATVAILPEADDIEVTINPQDVRVDVYRASGAGGQHVNTTDSAVRLTHIPTGTVVTCQDERSQHKNKAKAFKVLQARLRDFFENKKAQEIGQQRKQMIGDAARADKVRTYNYPQNRVTDHQVNITLNKLDMVMEGNLDDIIEPLIKQADEERRHQNPVLQK